MAPRGGGERGIFWEGRGSPWELAKNPASCCQQRSAGVKLLRVLYPSAVGALLLLPPKIPALIFLFHYCYYCCLLIPGEWEEWEPLVEWQPLELEFPASSFGVFCAAGAPSGTGTLHASTLSHIAGAQGINLPVFIWLQQPPLSLWGSPFWVLPFGVSCSGCLRLIFNTPFLLQEGFKKSPQCQWEAVPAGGFGGVLVL